MTYVFAVCTPYTAPHRDYLSLEELASGPLPQFGYQIHLASGEVEKFVNDEASIRQFLKGTYGAKGPNGELSFDPITGISAKNLPLIGESRILNGKVSSGPCEATQASVTLKARSVEGRIGIPVSGFNLLRRPRSPEAVDETVDR